MYSRHLFIKTNQSCNLKCIYCYEKEKKNKTFDIDIAYQKICNILQEKTPHGTKIKLIGGEPFLVFDTIRKFCEKIWGSQFDEKIHFQITTNGTLVHGDIQDWLKENRLKIECKLSLDGSKESQDINRPNSFDKIDIPFFVKTWNNSTINMVVTPQTLPSFADNVIFLHEQGFKNIVPIFAVLTDWFDKKLQTIYYKQLLILAKFYVEHPNVKRCHTLNLHMERLLHQHDCIICDIGKKIIYDIDSEKYYPCHLFFPSVCGNNCPKNMNDLDFSRRSTFELAPCKSCNFINICHTCYAANYIERGDLGKRDMTICNYRKIDFLINAQIEYQRIINKENISIVDYNIMQAIHKVLPELDLIKNKYE